MENKKWYTYTHSIIMLSIIGVLIILLILLVLSNIEKNAKVKEEQIIAQNPEVVFPLMEDTGLILFYQKI